MGGAGMLLLVCAVPEGFFMALFFYSTAHFELRLAIIAAVAMALAMVIAGSILLWVCIFVSKRNKMAGRGDSAAPDRG